MDIVSTATVADYMRQALKARKEGREQAAISLYQHVLQLDSSNVKVQQLLGDLFFSKGDYDLARSSYIDSIKLSPDSSNTYFQLGRIAEIQAKTEEAVESYEYAIQLNSGEFKYHQALG